MVELWTILDSGSPEHVRVHRSGAGVAEEIWLTRRDAAEFDVLVRWSDEHRRRLGWRPGWTFGIRAFTATRAERALPGC